MVAPGYASAMPSFRPLGVGLLLVAVAALAAGCATGPSESASGGDVANNSTRETANETGVLPGFDTTAGQGQTPVQPPETGYGG